jgi:hypothetical protein
MNWARIAVLVLVVIEAGWMAFDGTRALIVGDFVTPKSGPYAGQLGPWHHAVEFVGLDPRGTPVKLTFAVYGWTWLLLGVAFALGSRWAWAAMLAAAIGSLWFLPIGTLCSVVQIILLLALRERLK